MHDGGKPSRQGGAALLWKRFNLNFFRILCISPAIVCPRCLVVAWRGLGWLPTLCTDGWAGTQGCPNASPICARIFCATSLLSLRVVRTSVHIRVSATAIRNERRDLVWMRRLRSRHVFWDSLRSACVLKITKKQLCMRPAQKHLRSVILSRRRV